MNEPKIVSAGHSKEQIYAWMKEKTQKAALLQSALDERTHLEQALADVELRIQQLIDGAAIEVLPLNQDSTHFP